MPQIDNLSDGGALRIDDDIPIERSAGTRKVHGLPADPPNASDSGTDAFQVNAGRDVNDEEVIVVLFDSSNTTKNPTLENTGGSPSGGKGIQLPDGSAIRVGAIQNSAHVLQYDSGTDQWFLLNPTGSFLVEPGTSSNTSLSFDTWRTPNGDRPTLVVLRILAETNGTSQGDVLVDVDESGGTSSDYSPLQARADTEPGDGFTDIGSGVIHVNAGGSYQIRNLSDPNSNNSIVNHQEFTL